MLVELFCPDMYSRKCLSWHFPRVEVGNLINGWLVQAYEDQAPLPPGGANSVIIYALEHPAGSGYAGIARCWHGVAYLFGFLFPVLLLTLPCWFLQRAWKEEMKTAFRWVTGPSYPWDYSVYLWSLVSKMPSALSIQLPLHKLVQIEVLSFAIKRDLINSTTETPSLWIIV